ncbi:Mu transposase C-terminal domain-containing protein [Pararhizobium sp. O133]|uniref:Mu transposase C-terminal domain-containing protein n=1 Tax=Pararhizobium sp. O133 TaxID=3449278 RepID=UPI003F687E5C
MNVHMEATQYEIGPFDRVIYDGVEVVVKLDSPAGKAFERIDGNGNVEVLTNAQIHEALRIDKLVVEREHYNRKRLTREGEAEYLQNLPEKERLKIGHKLVWATLLRRKREELGGIPHEMRRIIMRQMRDEYLADYQAMRRLAHFDPKKKLTYESDEEPTLKVPSYESVSAWSLALERAGGDARVLRDRRGSGKNRTFTPEELHLQGRYVWRYLSTTEPRPAYLFKLMKAVERRLNRGRSKEERLKLGCRSTFYNRLDALPDFAKCAGRLGDAKALARYTIVVGKDRGHPMDQIEGDECRLNLVAMLKGANVFHALTKEEQQAFAEAAQRFWFSAVVDHSTTSFLSFRLHTRNPSIDTARATFELATRDKTQIALNAGCKSDWKQCGGFKRVRLDAASWYNSTAVVTTLTDGGAAKFVPPSKQPWLRGTMERLFGTLGALTLSHFSGQTFSNVVVRGDRDPKKGASVDPDMLEKVLLRAIVDIFHHQPNTGKLGGMTPNQAWMIGARIQPPPAPPPAWQRRATYGVNMKRTITREGIEFLGFFFQSEKIQEMRRNKTGVEVHIRVDLQDVSEITVFDGEVSYRVPCRLPQLRGLSYWEAAALLQELRAIDTEYTNRTLEQVDAAREYIDRQADLGRLKYSVATPIVTEEHLERLEKRIVRAIRIVDETEYTHEVSTQDWSGTPFSDEVFGFSDEAEGDDLDNGKMQTAKAVAEKYATPAKKTKKRKSHPVEATEPGAEQPDGPENSDKIYSARYFDEH